MVTDLYEKLTRMKADTFRARLRLGLGFSGPIHVPENLKIHDTAVISLCDTLCVDGDLDLGGCVNLEALPGRLIVRGRLVIDGCSRITCLPATLREVFGFSARGCHRLTSIAPVVECRGRLSLAGCTALAPLPTDFQAIGKVDLGDVWIDDDSVFVRRMMPDTVLAAARGRRIGELIAHSALQDHAVLDAVVTRTLVMKDWGGVLFFANTSALVVAAD